MLKAPLPVGRSVTNSSGTKKALAGRAWQLLFDYLMSTRPARDQSLARRKLTPNGARALGSLDQYSGRPIGSLATDWGCDPSNATLIIDRLERLRLVERRPSAVDRRVKLVTLTARGAQTKAELLDEFHAPPPAFLKLDRADLEALERILKRL
jgi:DNA-binding MarR family transcriptional regulator